MISPSTLLFLIAASGAISSASAATVFNQDFSTTDYSAWVDGSGSVDSATISATVDGQAFTYKLRISGFTSGAANTDLIFSGQRPRFNATNSNSLLSATFAVVELTSVSSNVTFDGFTTFQQFDNSGEDGFNYSGSDAGSGSFTGASGGSSTINGSFNSLIEGDLTITAIDDTANGNFRIQELGLQFSAIPEPSSTALLGLAGVGLLLRRRK